MLAQLPTVHNFGVKEVAAIMRKRFTAFLALLLCAAANAAEQSSDPAELLKAAERDLLEFRFQDAAEKQKQALALFELQQNQERAAEAAFKLGVSFGKIGRYDEAESALKKARSIHQERGDRLAEGRDITELAHVTFKLTRYDDSLELTRQALQIFDRFGDKTGEMNCYRIIGLVHQYRGDHDLASKNTQRSYDLAVETGDKTGQAKALQDHGSIQWRMSNYDSALDYYTRALSLARETGDKKLQSQVFGNIGLIYWNRGQLKEALSNFERCDQIAGELGDLQTMAVNYLNMGAIQKDLEEYGAAKESLEQSLKLARQIGDKGLESAVLDTLGQYHNIMGDVDLALDLTKQAAAIAEEIQEKRTLAYEWKSIGFLNAEKQNYTEALAFYRKALGLYEELEEKRGVALTLNDMASMLLLQRKYDEARPLFEKTISIAGELKADFILQDSYRGIGWIHMAQKDRVRAEENFDKALELSRKIERPESIWMALHGKATLFKETVRPQQAVTLLKEAVEIIEKARSEVSLSEYKAHYMEEKLDLYEDLVRLLISSGNIPEAFEYAQRSKARAFLDMLAEARIDPERNMDTALRDRKKKLLKDLLGAQEGIRTEKSADSPDAGKIAQLTRKRNVLEMELNDLATEIRRQEPQLAALQYPQTISLPAAQALLDQNTVLLEYLTGKNECILFVITNGAAFAHILSRKPQLASQIATLRESLSRPEPVWEKTGAWHSKYRQTAHALYGALLLPAAQELKAKQRLLIGTDGMLNYLPFESLLMQKPRDGESDFSQLAYVGSYYEIQYVPSISVFAALQQMHQAEGSAGQKDLVAFANPDYTTGISDAVKKVRSSENYLALPNSAREVDGIAALFPHNQVLVLKGAEASEQNVKKTNLEAYKRLHFASHGAINEERPRLSALVLSSSSNNKQEDGFLTVQEVFELRLKADLVVLSACKTALGPQIRGEGVMGLSRAFLKAGSTSVLASLWNVNDQSTAQFMQSFYKHMNSRSKPAALKQARLELIQSSSFSHPYYWATFVLIGSD